MPGESAENKCTGLAPNSDSPQRCLLELSRPDDAAWQRLLARAQALRAEAKPSNLVCEALRLWAQFLIPDSARRLTESLRPMHVYWLQHCETQPLGFARLVVETARQRSLEDSQDPSRHSREAQQLLQTPGLASIDPVRHQQLVGLSLIYLADDLRCLGRHLEARKLLARAKQTLARDAAADDRILCHQVDAFCLRDQGKSNLALETLERAEGLLSQSVIPNSHSELLLCRGRLQLHASLMDRAVATLSQALARLSPAPPKVLKLEILHSLAVCRISLQDYQKAQQHLDAAAELYEFSHRELFAQRQWMLGRIALRQLRLADARGLLRSAIPIFLKLGRRHDTATTFSDLIEAYALDGRLPELLDDLDPKYTAILDSEAFRHLTISRLRQSKANLEHQGYDTETLDHWLRRLEPEEPTWIH